MSPFLANLRAKSLRLWKNTTDHQRIMVGGITVSALLIFFLLIYWIGRPEYSVLHDLLAPEDASRSMERLNTDKEPFRLADNGQTILVLANRVNELRLRVASVWRN